MADEENPLAEVYQIRVRGHLEAQWSEWLGELAVTYGGLDGRDTAPTIWGGVS